MEENIMKRSSILILIFCLIAMGCTTAPGPKETGGTLIGAGSGALLGSQIGRGQGKLVAVAVGTLAGALIGREVGVSLDRADKLAMEHNAQYSLEHTRTNTTTSWRNPDTNNTGAITPIETYQTREGQYCREYIQTVIVAGKEQQAYGTACRQPDGSWMVVR
jgi:surface antigen